MKVVSNVVQVRGIYGKSVTSKLISRWNIPLDFFCSFELRAKCVDNYVPKLRFVVPIPPKTKKNIRETHLLKSIRNLQFPVYLIVDGNGYSLMKTFNHLIRATHTFIPIIIIGSHLKSRW